MFKVVKTVSCLIAVAGAKSFRGLTDESSVKKDLFNFKTQNG